MSESNKKISTKTEDGFTLIEAVIAIFILTIGLVGTVAAITYAIEFGRISRNVSGAKSVIVASIEEVETLRNAQRLNFRQIANVGAVDNTDATNPFDGFSTGYKPVSLAPGNDGVFGTDDDLSKSAGADGKFGTSDDVLDLTLVRSGLQRQITISNLSSSLKKIEVRVRYSSREGKQAEIVGVGYLNDDARVTR